MKGIRTLLTGSNQRWNIAKGLGLAARPLCNPPLRIFNAVRYSSTQQLIVTDQSGKQYRLTHAGGGRYDNERISHGFNGVLESHKPQDKKRSMWKKIRTYAFGAFFVSVLAFYPELKDTWRFLRFWNEVTSVVKEKGLQNSTELLYQLREAAPIWATHFPEYQAYTNAFLQDFDTVYQKYNGRVRFSVQKFHLGIGKLALESGASDEAAKRAGAVFEKCAWEIRDIVGDVWSDVLSNHPDLSNEPDSWIKRVKQNVIAEVLKFRQSYEKQWTKQCEVLSKEIQPNTNAGQLMMARGASVSDEPFSEVGELLRVFFEKAKAAGKFSIFEDGLEGVAEGIGLPAGDPMLRSGLNVPVGDRIMVMLILLSRVERTDNDGAKEIFRNAIAEIEQVLMQKFGELKELEKSSKGDSEEETATA